MKKKIIQLFFSKELLHREYIIAPKVETVMQNAHINKFFF